MRTKGGGRGNRHTHKKEHMRKSSGMRDFSNFLEDRKQMGEWSSIKQRSESRVWNVHRGGTGGENSVTPQTTAVWGSEVPLQRKKEMELGMKTSPEKLPRTFSSPFRAGMWKRGQDSDICLRTSPVDLCSCPIGQNCRTWPSQAAKGADERRRIELGILPSQTISGQTGISNKWDKAVGSGWGMAAPAEGHMLSRSSPTAPWYRSQVLAADCLAPGMLSSLYTSGFPHLIHIGYSKSTSEWLKNHVPDGKAQALEELKQ